ncbi:MAG: hypothetical protein Q8Q09_09690 [Deltaproteobacteria bacterium]|nr:hypothetical protein [Deltaproteobacteria bacterium]
MRQGSAASAQVDGDFVGCLPGTTPPAERCLCHFPTDLSCLSATSWIARYDQPRAGGLFGTVPYTAADNGPAQLVSVAPFDAPIRSARNYDHGLCWVDQPLSGLSAQLATALLPQFFALVNGDTRILQSSNFRVSAQTGPWLRGSSTAAASVQDRLLIRVDARADATLPGALGVPFDAELRGDTTLRFSLGIAPRTVGSRTWNDVFVQNLEARGTADPEYQGLLEALNISGGLADAMRAQFRALFADQINAALTLIVRPDISRSEGPIAMCSTSASPSAQLAQCIADPATQSLLGLINVGRAPTDLLTGSDLFAGEGSGCFNPCALPISVTGPFRGQLPDPMSTPLADVCVIRLNPKRLNITPTQLQMVLSDRPSEVDERLVRQLTAVSRIGSTPPGSPVFRCDNTPPSPTFASRSFSAVPRQVQCGGANSDVVPCRAPVLQPALSTCR